jgi:hypothetical protein
MPVLVSPVVVRAGSSAVPAANVDTPVTPSVVPTVAAPVMLADANVETPVTPSVVPTVAAPVMVADARVAVPPAPRIWLTVTFFVVPLAAMLVSSRSTIGIGKVATLIGFAPIAARAVIFVSAMASLLE